MTREQKIYCKVGQVVCDTLGFLFITGIFTAIGIGFFMQKGVRKMFTKKDRKIANQEAMIDNRNKLIKALETRNNMLKTANKDLRFENEELLSSMKQILNLSTSNTYNNDKIILSKIKELAETAINDQF